MKTKSLALVVLLTFLASGLFAQVKPIPQPVKEWFSDVVVMMTKLVKDMNGAKTAKAVAAAFDAGTATIRAKKLGERYLELEAKYPEFMNGDDEDYATGELPKEWEDQLEAFNEAWAEYGESFQAVMKYAQDPGVQKSMEAFSEAMESIDGGSDDADATTAASEEY